jgi:hypothetical protein
VGFKPRVSVFKDPKTAYALCSMATVIIRIVIKTVKTKLHEYAEVI